MQAIITRLENRHIEPSIKRSADAYVTSKYTNRRHRFINANRLSFSFLSCLTIQKRLGSDHTRGWSLFQTAREILQRYDAWRGWRKNLKKKQEIQILKKEIDQNDQISFAHRSFQMDPQFLQHLRQLLGCSCFTQRILTRHEELLQVIVYKQYASTHLTRTRFIT